MGVKFGYLIKEKSKRQSKTPAVYIYTPECYDNNVIISKEFIHKNNKDVTLGYTIYNDNRDLIFIDNVDNGLNDEDCDNIIVLIDLLCRYKDTIPTYITLTEIEYLKENKYNISNIKEAQKHINIL